jgi:Putative peptidoglycan binding domain/Resolvase, N terminal domain
MILALALLIPGVALAAEPRATADSHGRAIQAPQRQSTPPSLPTGWSAGPVRFGTGFRHAGGSQRVREVQQRLSKLGFAPGPLDGLFGPRTYAAVLAFQTKHGLAADGIVGALTLTALRQLTGAETPVQQPARGGHPAARGTTPQPRDPAQRPDQGHKPAGGRGPAFASTWLVVIALLLLAAPAALALRRRRTTTTPKPRRPPADRETAGGPAHQSTTVTSPAVTDPAATSFAATSPAGPRPLRPRAIGYVRSTRGAELARHAGTVKRACSDRGWDLAELIRDDGGGSRMFDRPGLAAAMERLAEPGPALLVVSKLDHLSHSAAALPALFEWFERHEVQVVAADVELDTTTPAGRRAAQSVLVAFAERQARARGKSRTGARQKVEVGARTTRPGGSGAAG